MLSRLAAAAVLLLVIAGPALAQGPAAPTRAITKIAGEIYRFQNNAHFSIFAVTPDGIIATDPVNADAAKWLKDELKKRFNKPVKYLVYSHDHADHIAGGEIFADTATVIAHENAKPVIIGEKRPTAVPQITFSKQMTIELGGTVLELTHVGKNHSNNSIVMRFPKEGVLFAVDFIPVKALAFRDLPDAYMPDWIDSLKRVEQMEFAVLAPGHGELGTKDDVRAFRAYLTELHDSVLAAARAGKSVDDMKKEIVLEKYQSWGNYAQFREFNIEGMARLVQANRRGN